MSLKPPKKSDLGKSWMKARRDQPKRIRPEYHLIITEGTKTEPAYFSAMRDVINHIYPNRIQLDVVGAGNNTLHLFQKAQHRVRASANVYRHVWIVYDTDEFPAEHINETARLCEAASTEETAYHAIWSNQCIEIWFLLHFQYLQADIHRNVVTAKLTNAMNAQGLGAYAKNRRDMYEVLHPFMDTALMYARRLDKENSNRLPSDASPGTKVHVLIEKLKPYLGESGSK